MGKNKKSKSQHRRFLSFLIALCLCIGLVPLMPVPASANTGGTGTEADPFLVNNEADLRMVGRGQAHTGGTWSLSAHYRLTANITLTGENNWTPIGTDAARFTGTFDGNGWIIDGLHINQPIISRQGMFSVIGANGSVRNLGLTNVDITGIDFTGGIAGWLAGGTISGCFVTGTVSGGLGVGGIAGRVDNATVSNCYSAAKIYGSSTQIGGIVGSMQGSGGVISYCYATGSVANVGTGTTANIGGATGFSQGTVRNTVALNPYVVSAGSSGVGRIGGVVSTPRNNYGIGTGTDENQMNLRSGVAFVGTTPILTSGTLINATSGLNGRDGSTLTDDRQYTREFWTTPGNWFNNNAWSTDIWTINDGSLPTLAWFHLVNGITGIPATANAGTPLTLNATVSPVNATNQNIVWTVKDAGTTGATISGNTLSTTAGGTVVVTATIASGATMSTEYTQDFSISVIMRKAIIDDQTSASFSVDSDNLQYILDNHIVTDEDIKNNNSVTLTLTVKETDDSAKGAEEIIVLSQGRLLQFFDITVKKQINNDPPVELFELPAPVEITINLSPQLSGKTGYTVYRYHNGVQRIGTNTETDEFFTVSRGSGENNVDQIIINTKRFSTYAVVENIRTLTGADNQDDVDVQARIIDLTTPVYRNDITWGDMKFIYHTAGYTGDWNPETKTYENPVTAGWSGFENGNNEIIVHNHSNADVRVSFAVTNSFEGDVTMKANQVNDNTDVPAVNMALRRVPVQSADAPNINAFLRIDGEPSADDVESMSADAWHKIGVITVTITPDGDVLTPLTIN